MPNRDIMILLIVFVLVYVSCKAQSERSDILTIDIESAAENLEVLSLSQYADSIWYITMESDDLLLRNLRLLDKRDHLLLVSDMNEIALFSYQGEFLSKIGTRGRGPEEDRKSVV